MRPGRGRSGSAPAGRRVRLTRPRPGPSGSASAGRRVRAMPPGRGRSGSAAAGRRVRAMPPGRGRSGSASGGRRVRAMPPERGCSGPTRPDPGGRRGVRPESGPAARRDAAERPGGRPAGVPGARSDARELFDPGRPAVGAGRLAPVACVVREPRVRPPDDVGRRGRPWRAIPWRWLDSERPRGSRRGSPVASRGVPPWPAGARRPPDRAPRSDPRPPEAF
jgi:hypothetical protein